MTGGRDVNNNTSSSIKKVSISNCFDSETKQKRLKMLNTDRKENKNVKK